MAQGTSGLRSSHGRRRVLLASGGLFLVCYCAVGVAMLFSRPGRFGLAIGLILLCFAGLLLLAWAWHEMRRERAILEELREDEARLRLLTQQAPADVWTTDTDLRLTSILGALIPQLENAEVRRPGRTLYELFGTRDPSHPAIAAHLQALRGESAAYERADGDHLLEGRVEPLRDDRGKVIGCVGIATDVSTWRWAESQVRRFAALVQSSEDAIISTDVDGTIETWNPAAERLYGYSAAEAIGRPITIVAPPGREPEIDGNTLALRQGVAVGPYEAQRRRRDGRVIWVSVTVSPIRDASGRVEGMSGIVRDVTERKRMEEALGQSEERLRSLFTGIDDALFVHDTEGRILDCNEAACRRLGYAREELLAMRTSDIDAPEFAAGFPTRLAEQLDQRRGVYEGIHVARGGRRIPVNVNTCLIEYHGKPAVLAVMRDVTERRRIEESLRHNEAQLRELARHVESVREEEQARMARQIHDEVGQALTALRFDASWLARQFPNAEAGLQVRIRDMIRLADEAIEAGRRIVAELRPPILDDLGLGPALEWYTQDFAQRTGIDAAFEAGPQPLAVSDDLAVTAYRIAQEALTNVARHAQASHVAVRLDQRDGALTLEIADDGRGVPGDEASSARSLGIIGMRERALGCGGGVAIEGAPGRGTTVRLTIPIEDRERP